MPEPRFLYPVYNPCYRTVNAAHDWGLGIFDTTHDLDHVLSQPFKVAAVPVFYDDPDMFTWHPDVPKQDLSRFDLVLVSDPEYYDVNLVRDWINKQNIQHYVLATGGKTSCALNTHNELYRAYYIRPFLDLNCYQETRSTHKPFLFDALLGAQRPHRSYVMRALTRVGLLDQCIATYRRGFPGSVMAAHSSLDTAFPGVDLAWPYVSPNLDPSWEVADNVNNQVSFLSPLEIYRRCWYSIVCETLYTGSDFFLSEKTIKAMFNRRITVTFAPAGFLAHLRSQGFATFSNVMDESFDQEPRDHVRFNMVMHQLMQLAWFEDPVEIYRSCRELLDHNHQRLQELELARLREQREMLHQHIPGHHWLW
jgi:hypothetical protein